MGQGNGQRLLERLEVTVEPFLTVQILPHDVKNGVVGLHSRSELGGMGLGMSHLDRLGSDLSLNDFR